MRSSEDHARCIGRLTIVGGVRDALAAWRLGRREIVRPRRHRALLRGPSTSPLCGRPLALGARGETFITRTGA